MVIFDNVKKFILHDVDLHIPRGITLGIIGASGAGKTTFLKLISGILEPESGVVRTLRRDPVEKAGGFLRRISVLFADIPVFDENLSIIDCLEETRIMYGMKQREYNERLDYISGTLDFTKKSSVKIKAAFSWSKKACRIRAYFFTRC